MDNNCPLISVGHGRMTIVDPDCYAALAALSWHVSTSGYVVWRSSLRNKKHITIRMHREVFRLKGIEIPEGLEVDHINHDRLDNRFCNLRLCTRSLNLANRPYVNRTGYRGVVRRADGKYRAYVQFRGQKYRTTQFSTPEEAARARDELAKQFHGEFATLNFNT